MFEDKEERRKKYQKEYREKNKDKWKIYHDRYKDKRKEYRIKNRDRLKEWKKNYVKKNIDKVKERRKKYYQKTKEHRKDYIEKSKDRLKQYRIKNKDKIRSRGQKRRNGILKSWESVIPKEINCQICGKKIYFNQNNRKDAIHFDHKNEIYSGMQKGPTYWLLQHRRTSENQKIWEMGKFGTLFRVCNSRLPTSNRKQFIINVIKYMGLDEIILDLINMQQEMKLVEKKPLQEENLL